MNYCFVLYRVFFTFDFLNEIFMCNYSNKPLVVCSFSSWKIDSSIFLLLLFSHCWQYEFAKANTQPLYDRWLRACLLK